MTYNYRGILMPGYAGIMVIDDKFIDDFNNALPANKSGLGNLDKIVKAVYTHLIPNAHFFALVSNPVSSSAKMTRICDNLFTETDENKEFRDEFYHCFSDVQDVIRDANVICYCEDKSYELDFVNRMLQDEMINDIQVVHDSRCLVHLLKEAWKFTRNIMNKHSSEYPFNFVEYSNCVIETDTQGEEHIFFYTFAAKMNMENGSPQIDVYDDNFDIIKTFDFEQAEKYKFPKNFKK